MDLLEQFRCFFGYCRTQFYTPFTLTPTTTARRLFNTETKVSSFLIRVRSLGTATYVGVGDQYSQAYRMTTNGESIGWTGSPWEYFDLYNFFIVSDSNDSVCEILAVTKEPVSWA